MGFDLPKEQTVIKLPPAVSVVNVIEYRLLEPNQFKLLLEIAIIIIRERESGRVKDVCCCSYYCRNRGLIDIQMKYM